MLLIVPLVSSKLNWLFHSEKTNGQALFTGKSITGQLVHQYAVISFSVRKKEYWFNGNDNILYKEGESVPVRYNTVNPYDARINVFVSIWGDTLVFGGIPLLILMAVFIHPQIIPRHARIRFQNKKPFVVIIPG